MRAVVLAGGKGTRLAPYTAVFPKPLMPLGDMPILEVLIRRLASAGVDRVTLTVGHLAWLIQAFFADGQRIGVPIDYAVEDEPLGTAGPLGRIDRPTSSFLVLNGDLLTDLDLEAMIASHRESGRIATVGLFRREQKIDFGVVEVADDGLVEAYHEKPVTSLLVSMGVYVLEPEALDLIPAEGAFDLPDLVRVLVASGQDVGTFEHDGYWLDIGRPDDYAQAQIDAPEMLDRLLPRV